MIAFWRKEARRKINDEGIEIMVEIPSMGVSTKGL